jgi:thiamine pyrophosphokinase
MGAPSTSKTSSDTIIVVTGGDRIDPATLPTWPPGALVVAADSGLDRAEELGLKVDVAVGDFDSVTPAALARAEAAGVAVERHAAAKDATDMELALEVALGRGARHVVVLGGGGGRLDHLLANALLLASPRWAAATVVAQMGAARVTVVREAAQLTGRPGDLVSLLAVHGSAEGVSTGGLLYPLRDEALLPGSSRGVSNQLTGTTATVELRAGVLLAVQPGRPDQHEDRRSAP